MKKKLNKTVSLIFFLALISLSSTTALIPLVAAEYPNGYFYFKPTDYIYTTDDLSVGDTFQAEIYCQNLLDLYAWQVMVSFNATLLNVQSMGFLPDEPLHQGAHMKVGPDIDNAAGTVLFAVTSLETFGVDTILETGLCYIVFKIMASPPTMGYVESDLTLVTTGAPKCKWETWDPALTVYPDVTDGYYKYSWPRPPPPPPALIYVNPERIVNRSLNMCTHFLVNMSIINATYLYSLEFKLGFNPDVLNISDVQLGEFFPTTVTVQIEVNNATGFLWFNATLHPLEMMLEGNGTIVSVIFHVTGSGASSLTLYDTSLKDPTGEPLPHATSDGYFNNEALTSDINGDGVVDISDLAEMGRAYGSYPSHPRWDPSVDINRDEIIDLLDIVLVARDFGKTL